MGDSDKKTDVPGYRKRVVVAARQSAEHENGAAVPYRSSVSPPGPPTRADVEARLQATSDSISSRLEMLQSEMGLDGKIVKEVASKPFVSVVIAATLGYAVGKLLGSLRGNKDNGGSALADLLTDEVVHALEEDQPIDDTIRRVLRAVDIDGDLKTDKGSTLRWASGMVLRSIIGHSLRELSNRLTSKDQESD